MINKMTACLVFMLIGMCKVHAALPSNSISDEQESLHKAGVEKGCGIEMIHFVFTNSFQLQLEKASCDLVINTKNKTLQIRPCKGDCTTEKRFAMIVQWIKEKSKGIEEYKWVANDCE